jgi:replication-associated recombination protein RarA
MTHIDLRLTTRDVRSLASAALVTANEASTCLQLGHPRVAIELAQASMHLSAASAALLETINRYKAAVESDQPLSKSKLWATPVFGRKA